MEERLKKLWTTIPKKEFDKRLKKNRQDLKITITYVALLDIVKHEIALFDRAQKERRYETLHRVEKRRKFVAAEILEEIESHFMDKRHTTFRYEISKKYWNILKKKFL